jgi:hypothetical protein
MRPILIALAGCSAVVGTAAQAQYYPPPGYYDDSPPPPYYRRPPPGYGGPPPGYYGPPPGQYYGPQYYPRGDSWAPLGAPVRSGRGDPGHEPWRPRLDPRNGGLYCVQAGFTVQDGICKPGRRY